MKHRCPRFLISQSTGDVAFAYGAGLQWRLGQWAVRGEYERFGAAGAIRACSRLEWPTGSTRRVFALDP